MININETKNTSTRWSKKFLQWKGQAGFELDRDRLCWAQECDRDCEQDIFERQEINNLMVRVDK